MKSFTIHKYMYILSNINIKKIRDLQGRDVNLRDITLYLYHVNKYLNKNLHFINKDFISNILDSISSSENAIYIDYYKYILSAEFVKKPTFNDFLALLNNLNADQLDYLKERCFYYNIINKLSLEGKSRIQLLDNIRQRNFEVKQADFIKYSSEDLYNKVINFKQETFKQYLKPNFITLRELIFNQNKFTNSFMKHLTRLVSKLYNKEVVFNVVNLRDLYLNSDIYTQAVFLKLKNRDNKLFDVFKKVH